MVLEEMQNVILINTKMPSHDYDIALKLDPNNIIAYNQRGVTKSQLDEYQSAIADFDKAIELAFILRRLELTTTEGM